MRQEQAPALQWKRDTDGESPHLQFERELDVNEGRTANRRTYVIEHIQNAAIIVSVE